MRAAAPGPITATTSLTEVALTLSSEDESGLELELFSFFRYI